MASKKQDTQEQGPSVSKATATLTKMLSDIPGTAQEVSQGEFSENGAGTTGIAFRIISTTDESQMEDVWANMISLCGKLWEADHLDAATTLIETSSRTFFIPQSMEDRVSASIKSAQELKTITYAEKSFADGDDEKALRESSKISSPLGQNFKKNLSSRIQRRRRTRAAAVWVSGVSISMLLAITAIGGVSLVQLFKEPPSPKMPKFQESERVFNDLFRTGAVKTDPPKADSLSAAEESVDPENEGTSRKIPDLSDLKTVITPPLAAEAPPVAAPPKQNIEPTQKPRNTKQISRQDCILGFASLQKATTLIVFYEDQSIAKKKVAQFMSDLQGSCKSLELDAMTLNLEASMIDPQIAEAIARGILE